MVKKIEVKSGDKFNMLTVLEEVELWVYPSGETRRQFLMQCDCGSAPKKMLINNFKTGSTKSCGCYNKQKNTTHGMNETRQYQCWADMKTRCDNTKNKFYDYYGGRGIYYCDKWKTFEGFWEDMQEGYSDELTLNRRDNDGPYCKENCAWDIKSFQQHMRRKQTGTIFAVIGATESCTDLINAGIKHLEYNLHLGAYRTEQEVAEAYDHAAQYFYGDRPNKTLTTRPEIVKRVEFYLKNKDITIVPRGEDKKNSKLKEQDAIEIWDLLRTKTKTQKELAEIYGVHQSTISAISKGSGWTHVTGASRKTREKMPFGISNVFHFNNKQHCYWAISRVVNGKQLERKSFSVTKLGNEQAKVAAEEYRKNWIADLTKENHA